MQMLGNIPVFVNIDVRESPSHSISHIDKEDRRFYFKNMRIKWLVFPALVFTIALFILPSGLGNACEAGTVMIANPEPSSQDTQRPRTDYMTTLLARSTQPLGLKDDPRLQKYLSQPGIKWAIRSSRRYILN